MLNRMQMAIIKKDIRGITANRRMFSVLLVVPIVMTVVIPSIFILTVRFARQGDMIRLGKLLETANIGALTANLQNSAIALILNYILPVFFLLIPIMASSVMAASSFVGEKEKSTLETLFYCPLPLKGIFAAKIFASFLLSMAVSFFSFIVMILVVEMELFISSGTFAAPDLSWLVVLFLVSPSLSLLAINLIVRSSAKSQSSEESQQRSVFLILPVIMLVVGQFTGIMLLSAWIFLILGVILAAIALFMFSGSFGKFKYETLLR